ncbi:MAG: YicC/YloC family endoribonuclease [Pirellulaceae bacterium]
MLLSMTGQGQGRKQLGSSEVTSEVRAVNNRHLKVHTRLHEGLGHLEPKIESLVRKSLRRGSLQLNVQVASGSGAPQAQLDEALLLSYGEQCKTVASQLGLDHQTIRITDLLALPGVVSDPISLGSSPSPELENAVLEAVEDAIKNLNQMRLSEGQAMAQELAEQTHKLREISGKIETRSPQVVDDYRNRLNTKISAAMQAAGHELQEADLAREVLIMADKADIREEVVRLASHLDQFNNLLNSGESQGRKLDFLIQEMFRETNTIGSKAGDAEIAQRVVDAKSIIEQMRELVQNVE